MIKRVRKYVVTTALIVMVGFISWKGLELLNFIGTRTATIQTTFMKVIPAEYDGFDYFFYLRDSGEPIYAMRSGRELSSYLDQLPGNEVTLRFLVNGRWVAWGILSPSFNDYYGPIEDAAMLNRDLIIGEAK